LKKFFQRLYFSANHNRNYYPQTERERFIMVLASNIFPVDFLKKHNLGVELYITTETDLNALEVVRDYARTVHLQYSGINLAANDEAVRRKSINDIKYGIETGAGFDVKTMVLHPCGVFSSKGEDVGSYAPMIDSLREIADFMAGKGLILSLENQVLRHPDLRIIAGCSSDEWFQLYKDVDRKNVTLTLDTSHAASASAHEDTLEKRHAKLWKFLDHPELISHFHWSDARLVTDDCQYADIHLVPGQGDLPRDFHKAIWEHPASKLFEQKCTEEELEAGLAFAHSL